MNIDIQKILKSLSIAIPLKIILQVFEAIFNFIIIRRVDPSVYGLTTITAFISNINLFFIRQCLKKAYMRRSDTTDNNISYKTAHNIMLLGVFATLAISIFFNGLIAFIYSNKHPYFHFTAWIYVIDSLLVSVYELFIVELTLNFEYKFVSVLDPVQLILGSFILSAFLKFRTFDSLLAFGLSQVLSKIIKIAFLLIYMM